jgi:hypothetical protein
MAVLLREVPDLAQQGRAVLFVQAGDAADQVRGDHSFRVHPGSVGPGQQSLHLAGKPGKGAVPVAQRGLADGAGSPHGEGLAGEPGGGDARALSEPKYRRHRKVALAFPLGKGGSEL